MTSSDHDPVSGDLARLLSTCPGRLSVAWQSSGGLGGAIDADRLVPAASTIKVAIMLAALRSVAEQTISLDDLVPIALPRVGGSSALTEMPSVTELPLIEVLALMIVISDNDATNATIDHVGLAQIEKLLADAGATSTRLQRRLMNQAAIDRGLQNVTTAADLVKIMVGLREGRLLGPTGTGQALAILRRQQDTSGLPTYLDDQVTVANKTGMLIGLRHDVALIERGQSWVAAAVTATDLVDGAGVDRGTAALGVFAEIGRLVAGLA